MESDAQIFEISDASLDDRFSADPLVTEESGIRHYDGATIRFDGYPIGTLGVMDLTPSVLTDVSDRARASLVRGRLSGLSSPVPDRSR